MKNKKELKRIINYIIDHPEIVDKLELRKTITSKATNFVESYPMYSIIAPSIETGRGIYYEEDGLQQWLLDFSDEAISTNNKEVENCTSDLIILRNLLEALSKILHNE